MRNSKCWKWIKVLLFVLVIILLNLVMVHGLLPNTYARIAVHNLQTDDFDSVYVGTSIGKSVWNPEVIDQETGRKSTNLCLGAEFPVDSYYLVREAMRTNDLERVYYELDPSYYVIGDYEGIQDPFIYNAMPMSLLKFRYLLEKNVNDDFRVAVFPWMFHRNQLPAFFDNWKMKESESYRSYSADAHSNEVVTLHQNGFMEFPRSDVAKEHNPLIFQKENVHADRVQDLLRMSEFCEKQNVEFIAVMLPAPEESRQEHKTDYEEAARYFSSLCEKNGISFLNFNEIEIGFDNSIDGYYDYEGHMWGDTANKFSKLFGRYVSKMDEY